MANCEEEVVLLQGRVTDLEEEVRRLIALATDRHYFIEAYRSMLGPIGLKVAAMWKDKRVKRVHHSWGPGSAALSGEQRAQFILDLEEAAKIGVPVDSIDSDIAR